jgi:hypothetical protein
MMDVWMIFKNCFMDFMQQGALSEGIAAQRKAQSTARTQEIHSPLAAASKSPCSACVEAGNNFLRGCRDLSISRGTYSPK